MQTEHELGRLGCQRPVESKPRDKAGHFEKVNLDGKGRQDNGAREHLHVPTKDKQQDYSKQLAFPGAFSLT